MRNNGVFLKPLKESDIGHVMTWVNDPDVVKNFQHFGKKLTKKEELVFVKKLVKNERKTDFVFSIFGVDETYLGQCAINQISWENRLGRFSLIIKKEHWGKGYAQKVLPILLDYAFRELKLNKVWGMVYATNEKALHLYKKAGFKREGLLREEYYWQDEYHDIVRTGLPASEFKK